jgi:2-methylcitrate dehydratase PrpD
LARQGFIGPTAPYEGRYGLYAWYMEDAATEADVALATAGLGDDWEVERVGVKPYPACHFVHGCVDAALALVAEQGLEAGQVERIDVLVPSDVVVNVVCEPEASKRRPISDYDAKFSIHYAVAAAIARGRFTLAELESSALSDPEILALADKVAYAVDRHSNFPEAYSGEVVVRTKDGRELRHREDVNRGAADRPLSNEEIVEKFLDNASMAVVPRRVEAIKAAVLEMERFDSAAELARCLAD